MPVPVFGSYVPEELLENGRLVDSEREDNAIASFELAEFRMNLTCIELADRQEVRRLIQLTDEAIFALRLRSILTPRWGC